jgi:hypothetical protein
MVLSLKKATGRISLSERKEKRAQMDEIPQIVAYFSLFTEMENKRSRNLNLQMKEEMETLTH